MFSRSFRWLFAGKKKPITKKIKHTKIQLLLETLEDRLVPAAFTPGNLAILDLASASATNTTGSVLELSPSTSGQASGGVQGLINIPSTGANAFKFSASGTSSYISTTSDGSLLAIAGYNTISAVSDLSSLSGQVRGVETFNAGANESASPVALFSDTGGGTNQTRAATSPDDTHWYVTGKSGLATNNSTTPFPLALNTGNTRSFGGTVYIATTRISSNGNTFGSAILTASNLTTSSVTVAGLSGVPTDANIEDFYLIQSGHTAGVYDVMYQLDSSQIVKYSLQSNGSWQSNGTFALTTGLSLIAAPNGSGGAFLYYTTGTTVVRVTDADGWSSSASAISIGSSTTLYTATGTGGDVYLKGIAFAPTGFIPGDIAVVQIGAGSAGNSWASAGTVAPADTGTAVFIDEYTTAGVFVQQIPMPTATSGSNNPFVLGNNNSEGLLNLSTDGKELLLAGYDTTVGSVAGGVDNGTTADPRVVGVVYANGTVDTSTVLTGGDTLQGANVREATGSVASGFYVAGQAKTPAAGGVAYVSALGGTTGTDLVGPASNYNTQSLQNGRGVQIANGQVYMVQDKNTKEPIIMPLDGSTSGSLQEPTNAYNAGSNPTSASPLPGTGSNLLIGSNTQALSSAPKTGDFFFAKVGTGSNFMVNGADSGYDTLYVADDAAALQKYSWNSSTSAWTSDGTIGSGSLSFEGLAGSVNGTTVTLLATVVNPTTGNYVVSITDNTGFGGSLSTITPVTLTGTVIPTADAGVIYRGIAFVPTAAGNSTAVAPTITTPTSSAIGISTATLGGNMTANGGATITKTGVVYALTSQNANPQIGGSNVTEVDSGTAVQSGAFTVSATGLAAVSGYSFEAFATNSAGTTYTSVGTFSTQTYNPPVITTPTSGSITSTSASLGGNVTSNGGGTISKTGVVYALTSANANPQIGGSGVTEVDSGTAVQSGTFTVSATGLSAGSGYSFEAFAIDGVDTTYTSVATFTTLARPTVNTPTYGPLTTTTATVGGTVAANGGATVMTSGVVYALTSVNSNPQIGGPGVTEVDSASAVNSGAFTVSATGLTASSGYTFEAFATNSVGTAYSAATNFDTPSMNIITEWEFPTAPGTLNNSPVPLIGTGTATTLGMTNSYNGGSNAGDDVTSSPGVANPALVENTWRVRGSTLGGSAAGNGWATAASGAAQYSQGAQFDVSTMGYSNIHFSFDWYSTTSAIRDLQVQYNLNGGGGWVNYNSGLNTAGTYVATPNDFYNGSSENITVDLSNVAGAGNNSDLGIRLVSAFDSTGHVPGDYANATLVSGQTVLYTNGSGNWRFDNMAFSSEITTTDVLTTTPTGAQHTGSPVTFTDTITPASGSHPTGTVEFYDGNTLVDTANVLPGAGITGVATYITSTLALGSHTITAQYNDPPGNNFADDRTSSTFSIVPQGSGTPGPFTPGNLALIQIGDGSLYNTEAPLYLNEITQSGAGVQQEQVPSTLTIGGSNNQPLTLSIGTQTSSGTGKNGNGDGLLNTTFDSSGLVFTGNDALTTDTSGSIANTPPSALDTRVLATVGLDPSQPNAFNTTTYGAFNSAAGSGDDMRGAVADSLTGPFYLNGHSTYQGLDYLPSTTTGGGTSGTVVDTGAVGLNVRASTIAFNGQLFYSTAKGAIGTGNPLGVHSGIFTSSSFQPTTAGTDNLVLTDPGTGGNPNGFAVVDMNGDGILDDGDRIYFVDNTSGLYSSTLSGGVWSTPALLANPQTTAPNYVGLTAQVINSTTVQVYFTSYDGTGNTGVYGFLDNGSNTSVTTLLTANAPTTAGTAINYAGIAYVPVGATTLSLTASPQSSTPGATVTLTAHISSPNGTPSGSVYFVDNNGTVLNPGGTAINAGSQNAVFMTTSIPLGQNSIHAYYSGGVYNSGLTDQADESIAPGTSANKVVSITGSGTSSTSTVSAPSNVATVGQTVTFSATVTAVSPTTPAPSGTVEFFDGSLSLGTATLSGTGSTAIASLPVTGLGLGGHSITADYYGDSNYRGSNDTSTPFAVTVNPAATISVVGSTSGNDTPGASVSYTATVTGNGLNGSPNSPAGTVTFYSYSYATGQTTALETDNLSGSGNVVTVTSSSQTVGVGSVLITAVYNGNASYSSVTTKTPFIETGKQAFAIGDLIVLDRQNQPSNASQVVALLEYNTGGGFVQAEALPDADVGTATHIFGLSGHAATEGALAVSANQALLTAFGFDLAIGTPAATSSDQSVVARTVGQVNIAAGFNTATAVTVPGDTALGNVRAAVTLDGNEYWVAGDFVNASDSGIRYISPAGATSSVAVGPAGAEGYGIELLGNAQGYPNIFVSTKTDGIDLLGSHYNGPLNGTNVPLPTTQTSFTALPGLLGVNGYQLVNKYKGTPNPYGFLFFNHLTGNSVNPDTLYIADQLYGLLKFANTTETNGDPTTGEWDLQGQKLNNNTSVEGLVGTEMNVPPPGTVSGSPQDSGYSFQLYATAALNNGNPSNQLLSFNDSVAFNAYTASSGNQAGISGGLFTVIANAGNPTDTFSGLSFAPTLNDAPTTVTSSVNPDPLSLAVTFTATVADVTGGPTPTGTVTFNVDGTAYSGTVTQNTVGSNIVASITIANPWLTIGSHTITANYSGDSVTGFSAGSFSETVNNTFAPGDIISLRAGGNNPVNNSPTGSPEPQAPLYLDEYTQAGLVVESIPLANNGALGSSSITTISENVSSVVTVTTSANNNFVANQLVNISGFSGASAGYNGDWLVTPVGGHPTEFTYTDTNASGLPTVSPSTNPATNALDLATGDQPITLDLSAAAGNGQLNRSYDGTVLSFGGVDSATGNGIYGNGTAVALSSITPTSAGTTFTVPQTTGTTVKEVGQAVTVTLPAVNVTGFTAGLSYYVAITGFTGTAAGYNGNWLVKADGTHPGYIFTYTAIAGNLPTLSGNYSATSSTGSVAYSVVTANTTVTNGFLPAATVTVANVLVGGSSSNASALAYNTTSVILTTPTTTQFTYSVPAVGLTAGDAGTGTATVAAAGTPTGSANRATAVVTNNPSAANFLNSTTYGPYYVGDDNRAAVAESATGPIYTAGHPNSNGNPVSGGVQYFATEGPVPTPLDQVSSPIGTNIRGVTIGFDNRMYWTWAGGGSELAGVWTETAALPTSQQPVADVPVVLLPDTKGKLGGLWLADMNGDGVVDNDDRLYFVDDGTVIGPNTGGLYVSTWNTANTQNSWNSATNHWSAPVRLGDAPAQTGSGGTGQLRGITGTVISSTEAIVYANDMDNAGGDNSHIWTFDDKGSGVQVLSATYTASDPGDSGNPTVTLNLASASTFQVGQQIAVTGVAATGTSGASSTYGGDNGNGDNSAVGDFIVTAVTNNSGTSTYTVTYQDSFSSAAAVTSGFKTSGVGGAADQAIALYSTAQDGTFTQTRTEQPITTLTGGSVSIVHSGIVQAFDAQGIRGVAFAPVALTSIGLTATNPNPTAGTVTLTANLMNSQVAPTGSVSFIDENTDSVIGTATITNGSATLNAAFNSDDNVVAYYGGGGVYALSSATSTPVDVNLAGGTSSTTTLHLTPSAAAVGLAVTLSATVAPTSGSGSTPTGSVTFYAGSISPTTIISSVPLIAGVATFTTSFNVGTTVYASYHGNATYAISNTSQAETIDPNATASITPSANNVTPGTATVSYTATITAGTPSLGTPTGTVKFFVDGAASGAFATAVNLSGSGTFATATSVAGPALTAGSHIVTIQYIPAAGSPYVGFTLNTNTSTNGNFLIENAVQAFTPGDLVAVQRGDGSQVLGGSGTLTYVDEYNPTTGALVQQIAMPNVSVNGGNQTLVTSGYAGNEGMLSRSANGAYITLAGINIPIGTSFVTSSNAATDPRTIAELGLGGTVNSTTSVFGGTTGSVPNEPRGVVSNDGQEFWIVSDLPTGDTTDSGINYVSSLGATGITPIGPAGTSGQATAIYGGQLYVATGFSNGSGTVGIAQIGTGLPTTQQSSLNGPAGFQAVYDAAMTALQGSGSLTASPYQFLMLNTTDGTSNNPNLIYVADQNFGLLRFFYDSSTSSWVYGQLGGVGLETAGSFGQKLVGAGGAFGVTGNVVNPGQSNAYVQLYVTGNNNAPTSSANNTASSTPNQIDSFQDNNIQPIGAGGTPHGLDEGFPGGFVTPVAFVGAGNAGGSGTPNGNENFSGLSFVPAAPTATTLASSITSGTYGSPVTLTATVASTATSPPDTPLGTVTFMDGTTPLGTATVSTVGLNQVATLILSSGNSDLLGGGIHSITANYSPGGSSLPLDQSSSSTAATVTISNFLVNVYSTGGSNSTFQAGTSFVVTVQALGTNGQPTTSYSGGPVTITANPADPSSNFPVTSVTLTNGFGFTPGILKTVGSYTFTATAGSSFGASSTVTVTPGNAVYFNLTTPSTAITGTPFNVTVTAYDLYKNIATGYTGTVKLTSSNSTATFPINNYAFTTGGGSADNGTHTFSAILNAGGTQTISATDPNSNNPVISGTSAGITTRGLVVTNVNSSPTGFTATFNKAFVPADVSLYSQSIVAPTDVYLTAVSDEFVDSQTTDSVTLSYLGVNASSPLAFSKATTTAALFQSYLQTIPGLSGLNAVTVTGSTGGPFTINFAPGLPGISTLAKTGGSANAKILNAGRIEGSILIDPTSHILTFKASTTALLQANKNYQPTDSQFTYPVLPDATYQLTLVTGSGSGANANGFFDTAGLGLDGLNNGTTANFVGYFTTSFQANNTPVLAIPDFARGPDSNGDDINGVYLTSGTGGTTPTIGVRSDLANVNTVPTAPVGVPIALYNASHVTDVTFTLTYNPLLFSVSGAFGGSGSDSTLSEQATSNLVQVGGVNFISNTVAAATFHYTDSKNGGFSATPDNPLILGDILGVVPSTNSLISSITEIGNTVTVTTANPTGFTQGQSIAINGVNPNELITFSDPTNHSVTLAYAGTNAPSALNYVSGGSGTSAAAVQTYLQAIMTNEGLPTSDIANVTGNNGGPYTVFFAAGVDPTQLAVASGSNTFVSVSSLAVPYNSNANGNGLFTIQTVGSPSANSFTYNLPSATNALPSAGGGAGVAALGLYQQKELLQLGSITINSGGVTGAVASNGLHVNAYLGDVDGSGLVDGLDKLDANNVAATNPNASFSTLGFSAFTQTDPVIVAFTGEFSVDATVVSTINNFAAGIATFQIPIPPTQAPGLSVNSAFLSKTFISSPNAADPTLSLVTRGLTALGSPTISVMIDHPHPAGSTGLNAATLSLTYDPTVLSVSAGDITLGSISGLGTGWHLKTEIDPVNGQIGILLYGSAPITAMQAGSLVNIAFHVVPGAAVSSTMVQLVQSATPNGTRFDTSLTDAQGGLILSGGIDQVMVVTGAEAVASTTAATTDSTSPQVAIDVATAQNGSQETTGTTGVLTDSEASVGAALAVLSNGAVAGETVHAVPTGLVVTGLLAFQSSGAPGANTPMPVQVFQIGNVPLVNPPTSGSVPQQPTDRWLLALSRAAEAPADLNGFSPLQNTFTNQIWDALKSDDSANLLSQPTADSAASQSGQPVVDAVNDQLKADRIAIMDQVFAELADDTIDFGDL